MATPRPTTPIGVDRPDVGTTLPAVRDVETLRHPADLACVTAEFADRYLRREWTASAPPSPRRGRLQSPVETLRRWHDIPAGVSIASTVGDETARLLHEHPEIQPGTVAVITSDPFLVRHAVELHDLHAAVRVRIASFERARSVIEGCRAVVVGVGDGALSRPELYEILRHVHVAAGRESLVLTVVNGDPGLVAFGELFESPTGELVGRGRSTGAPGGHPTERSGLRVVAGH